jgi:hypothetical protein
MFLHEKYNELVLERKRLLEQEIQMLNQDFINFASQLFLAIKIHHVDKKIKEIENNFKGEN